MSTPTVKVKGRAGGVAVLSAGALCPRGGCGDRGHLLSDHVEEKARHCNKCACVAQDVETQN